MTKSKTVPQESMEIKPSNPLLTKDIRPISDWAEWLALWKKTDKLQQLIGLLHVGFDVPIGGQSKYDKKEFSDVDRIIFYLQIADGWCDNGTLCINDEPEPLFVLGFDELFNCIKKSPSEMRGMVAEKAFNMLCSNFFNGKPWSKSNQDRRSQEKSFNQYWKSALDSSLLQEVIHLFRAQLHKFSGSIHICNITRHSANRSHNEEHAVNFLLQLAKFLWSWKEADIDFCFGDSEKARVSNLNSIQRTTIQKAMPWMIEVLAYLDKLSLLENWFFSLNDECQEKLEEIALRSKISDESAWREDRQVTNLDEACYVDSKAAWFLRALQLKKSEKSRLDAIRVALEEKRLLEEKLQKLR